jgi:hypothetical protein
MSRSWRFAGIDDPQHRSALSHRSPGLQARFVCAQAKLLEMRPHACVAYGGGDTARRTGTLAGAPRENTDALRKDLDEPSG